MLAKANILKQNNPKLKSITADVGGKRSGTPWTGRQFITGLTHGEKQTLTSHSDEITYSRVTASCVFSLFVSSPPVNACLFFSELCHVQRRAACRDSELFVIVNFSMNGCLSLCQQIGSSLRPPRPQRMSGTANGWIIQFFEKR